MHSKVDYIVADVGVSDLLIVTQPNVNRCFRSLKLDATHLSRSSANVKKSSMYL